MKCQMSSVGWLWLPIILCRLAMVAASAPRVARPTSRAQMSCSSGYWLAWVSERLSGNQGTRTGSEERQASQVLSKQF